MSFLSRSEDRTKVLNILLIMFPIELLAPFCSQVRQQADQFTLKYKTHLANLALSLIACDMRLWYLRAFDRVSGACSFETAVLSDSVKDCSLKHCDRSGCYNSQRFIFTWSLQGHSSDTDAPATSYMALGQISAVFCFCLCRFNLTSHSIFLSFSLSLLFALCYILKFPLVKK